MNAIRVCASRFGAGRRAGNSGRANAASFGAAAAAALSPISSASAAFSKELVVTSLPRFGWIRMSFGPSVASWT